MAIERTVGLLGLTVIACTAVVRGELAIATAALTGLAGVIVPPMLGRNEGNE